MKRILFLLIITLALSMLAGVAQAMSSANFRLDWFTPLSGSGGAASSANFSIGLTVGQAVNGISSSANQNSYLGFWPGAVREARILIPIIRR